MGDLNTKFYHASTVVKRGRNRIDALKDENGNWITNPSSLRSLIINYYNHLFSGLAPSNVTLAYKDCFPRISENLFSSIHAPFTAEEIKQSLFDMAPFKVVGPDGIHVGFYQKMWEYTGKTLCDFALQFLSTGVLPEGINNTLLALIPKILS